MAIPRSTLLIFLFFAMSSIPAMSKKLSLHHHLQSHHPRDEIISNIVPDTTSNDDDDDDDDGERLALLHSQRVSEAGTCEVPKMHVIHVSDHYPGKYYLPHCTLLHRCGKHAGCCGTDRLRCVAAKKEKVTLHFYSVRVFGHGLPAERKIEKLVFTNHTRCACTPTEQSNRQDL